MTASPHAACAVAALPPAPPTPQGGARPAHRTQWLLRPGPHPVRHAAWRPDRLGLFPTVERYADTICGLTGVWISTLTPDEVPPCGRCAERLTAQRRQAAA